MSLAPLSDCDAGVQILTLARPDKANALSAEMVEALHAALDGIDPATRTLLLRGEGRNFCAGFDFNGFEGQSEGDLLLRFVRIHELLARLRTLPLLTIAWIHGAAYGAGADIACACAVRVAAGPIRMRFPGFQFGIALGTRRLAAIAGPDRARAILLGQQELDTDAALAAGLVTEPLANGGAIASAASRAATDADQREFATRWAARTARMDAPALAELYRLTDADDADAELAALVRSAARPGLKARIAAYRAG